MGPAWHWSIRNILATLAMTGVLFGGAGDLGWLAAWMFVGSYVVYVAMTARVALVRHPDLLAERVGIHPATVGWDRWLAPVSGVAVPLLVLVFAAVDHRFGWTPLPVHSWWIGVVGLAAGYGLLLAAMAVNRFFSAGVRIQKERGQTTVRGGPYAVVRHPGYAGLIILLLATPVVLGSGVALLPAAVAIGLTVLRAAWEDRLLCRGLEGYPAYAAAVRYRLAPGLW